MMGSMIVLALAMLSLLPQHPPAPEKGSGYEFVVPKGWTRKPEGADKATTLVPTGSKDVRLILYPLYPVENGTYANENHFHVAMLQALTENGEKKSDPVTGRTGAFQWSRVKFTAEGTPVQVAAYTAKLRKYWALVAFAAPAATFETHLPTVEQFVKELKSEDQGVPAAAGAQAFHGLLIPLPEGWNRKDAEGAVQLLPPDPGNYVVIVLSTQPLRGTLWETQRALFDEVVKGSGLRKTVAPAHEPDSPGPFLRSSTAGDDANGSIRAVRLYSAPSEGGLECVVVFGPEDFGTTGAMLQGSKVRTPAKEAPRPKLVGAYRRLSQQTHVETFRGEQLITAVPYDRLWLRSDGLADFSPIYREGVAASRAAAKTDPMLQNGRYGSWKSVGEKEVHVVRRAGQAPEIYVRDGASLRLGDKVYESMPFVDGLTLEGRWHLPGAERKRRIEFTAAGRFKDDGLLEDVGVHPVPAWGGSREVLYPRPPARGEGTYEIREFTLFLKYDDGRVWSGDFSTFGSDPKDLSKLLLKAGVLHREP
jgi:hypothetical protein